MLYWSAMTPAFNLYVWLLGLLWSTFPLVGSTQTLADRLGYPPGTKMIIIHADDLGETHAVNAAAIKALESGAKTSRDEAVEALRKAEPKPWFDIAYLPKASELTNDPEHDPDRRRLDDDPIAAVEHAKLPLLFLYGDSDPWVPVTESVKRLQSLTTEMPNIQYAVVQNANHEMMFSGNETMQVDDEATRKEAPQAPTYFMLLASWIDRPSQLILSLNKLQPRPHATKGTDGPYTRAAINYRIVGTKTI